MFKKLTILVLTLTALMIGACTLGPTGDTASDPESAQSLMPNPPGYTVTDTNSIQDAIATALGGATLASGNLPAAAAIERLDSLIDCYRQVGAVDAKVFVSSVTAQNPVPIVGAVAVINETRAIDNLLNCALTPPGAQTLPGAGGPCVANGRITYRGNSIAYVYGASSQTLCDQFSSHFTSLNNQ